MRTLSLIIILIGWFANFSWGSIPPPPSNSTDSAPTIMNGIVGCLSLTKQGFNNLKSIQKNHPNNTNILFLLGHAKICFGDITKGIQWIKKAEEKDHLMATLTMALYYRSDKTFKEDFISESETNRDVSLQYLEKGLQWIKKNPYYPTKYNWTYESTNQLSVQFVTMTLHLYHIKYLTIVKKLTEDFKPDNSQKPLKILKKMQNVSHDCLKRPSLLAWGQNKNKIYRYQQQLCKNYSNLTKNLILLEEKRVQIANICSNSTESICKSYIKRNIQLIIQESNYYTTQISSIPSFDTPTAQK